MKEIPKEPSNCKVELTYPSHLAQFFVRGSMGTFCNVALDRVGYLNENLNESSSSYEESVKLLGWVVMEAVAMQEMNTFYKIFLEDLSPNAISSFSKSDLRQYATIFMNHFFDLLEDAAKQLGVRAGTEFPHEADEIMDKARDLFPKLEELKAKYFATLQ